MWRGRLNRPDDNDEYSIYYISDNLPTYLFIYLLLYMFTHVLVRLIE